MWVSWTGAHLKFDGEFTDEQIWHLPRGTPGEFTVVPTMSNARLSSKLADKTWRFYHYDHWQIGTPMHAVQFRPPCHEDNPSIIASDAEQRTPHCRYSASYTRDKDDKFALQRGSRAPQQVLHVHVRIEGHPPCYGAVNSTMAC